MKSIPQAIGTERIARATAQEAHAAIAAETALCVSEPIAWLELVESPLSWETERVLRTTTPRHDMT
jgi:hypothetical protein